MTITHLYGDRPLLIIFQWQVISKQTNSTKIQLLKSYILEKYYTLSGDRLVLLYFVVSNVCCENKHRLVLELETIFKYELLNKYQPF